jgi:general secretion pathway protein E
MESPWQQLKKGEIDCPQALGLLINELGTVNIELLDPEVSVRFFRLFSHPLQLPPVLPLLLWRNCYYLGSPIIIEANQHVVY